MNTIKQFPLISLILQLAVADLSSRRSRIFPKDYDKFDPPWKKGQPVDVYIGLSIVDIDEVNVGKMMYIKELWLDYRLNLTEFMDESAINPTFPTHLVTDIWQPDLIFDSTREGKIFPLSIPNTVILVKKNGYFCKESRYNLIVGCHMEFHFYPMDTQKCIFKIASLSNPDTKMLLHWWSEYSEFKQLQSVELFYKIQPLEYHLKELKSHKGISVWDMHKYTCLFANFTFVRRLSSNLFNVYIPSSLVVFLSWISFWIDVEAVPARVTLGVTSLLTLGTQVVQARSGLPAISYMTAMDVWLFACLMSVFCALLEFAFAYQINLRCKGGSRPSTLSQAEKPTSKADARVLWTRMKHSSNNQVNVPRKNIFGSSPIPAEGVPKNLDKICRIAFPLLFSIFSVFYWIFYIFLT